MRPRWVGLFVDAWKLWRADWRLLTAVAGPFLFLPMIVAQMLLAGMPDQPDATGEAAMAAWQRALTTWFVQSGWGLIPTQLIAVFGQLAIVSLYLSGRRPTVGSALRVALARYPWLIAAGFLIGFPMMMVLALGGAVPLLAPFVVVVAIVVAARLFVLIPVLFAERPIGPMGAIVRTFTLTRGSAFMLSAVVLTILIFGEAVGLPFALVGGWLAKNAPNPVAQAIIDAVLAAIGAASAVASGLAQVVAYRRLSSR